MPFLTTRDYPPVLTRKSSSATNITLAVKNTNRMGLSVFNESSAVLYLKKGATASLTDYSVQIPPGGYWTMGEPIYTGQVDGIWSAANGAAQVEEF